MPFCNMYHFVKLPICNVLLSATIIAASKKKFLLGEFGNMYVIGLEKYSSPMGGVCV